jgi:hypothetical protein
MLQDSFIFDIFLSFRPESDSILALQLREALQSEGLTVWWTTQQSSESLDEFQLRYAVGMLKCRIFMPLLSRGAINSPSNHAANFSLLRENSPVDMLLFKYMLAVELDLRGYIHKTYPVMIGEISSHNNQTIYGNYFGTKCHPVLAAGITVRSVVDAIEDCLEVLALGTSLVSDTSVKYIMDAMLKHQGSFIEGEVRTALLFERIVADSLKMKLERGVKRLETNDVPFTVSHRNSSVEKLVDHMQTVDDYTFTDQHNNKSALKANEFSNDMSILKRDDSMMRNEISLTGI